MTILLSIIGWYFAAGAVGAIGFFITEAMSPDEFDDEAYFEMLFIFFLWPVLLWLLWKDLK
jgi:hypothetical protein